MIIAASFAALRAEHARGIDPALAAETLQLERILSDLINQA